MKQFVMSRLKYFTYRTLEKKITLNFNWASILVSSFFISYGYYTAKTLPTKNFIDSINSILPLSLLLIFIQTLLIYLSHKKKQYFEDFVVIKGSDVLLFVSTLGFLFFISIGYLNHSLFSDELYYSTQAHRVGYGLFYLGAFQKWMVNLPFKSLLEIPVAFIIQGLGLLTLIFFLVLTAYLKKTTWVKKAIIFAALLLIFRVLISRLGAPLIPHPPLNLVPIFVAGSLFGLNDFALKLSSFLPYIIYVCIVHRMLSRKFDALDSFLMTVAISTIPLTLFFSTVVEQALWSSICFTIIMVDLITSEKPNYIRLISIASIATLFRQPSFVLLLPIAIDYIYREKKSIDSLLRSNQLFLLLCPTFIFLPFLIFSLIYGTPSTPSVVNEGLLSIFFRPIDALISGQVWISILNSVPIWWVIFIPLAFFPFRHLGTWQCLSFLIFFVALVLVFYTIHPRMWGEAKYQAEYAVPFAVVGFISLFLRLKESAKFKRYTFLLLLVLTFSNIYHFLNFWKDNKPIDQLVDSIGVDKKKYNSGFKMMATFPFSTGDAHRALKNAGFAENSYSVGVTYGVLPQVLAGYTVKEIVSASIISRDQSLLMKSQGIDWTTGNVDLIDSDARIKAVLIGFVFPNKLELINELKRKGWLMLGEFNNPMFGSTVVVLQRGFRRESHGPE